MIASAKGVRMMPIPTPLEVGPVNLVLLENSGCLTLVDTGPLAGESEAALRASLKELGVSVRDLDQIVLTHYHCDHTGLLEKLAEESGAKVYAHPLTPSLLRQDEPFYAERAAFFQDLFAKMNFSAEHAEAAVEQLLRYKTFMGNGRVDETLVEGAELPGHPGFQVVYTPGHAQDHLSLYRPDDGVMVLGDHLIRHISSNALIEPPARAGEERPKTLVVYREALRKVQQMDWTVGFPGHGKPVTEYRELIDKRLSGNEKRGRDIVEQIKAGKRTGSEITFTLFPHHMNQLMLIASETLGHLDWLEADGVIAREENERGVWEYRIV